MSEKTKPVISCTVEPGRMSTQTPTRNNCGAQTDVIKLRLRERAVGCSVRMALRADSSNARYRSGMPIGYRAIATHARETTRPCSASLQSSE
eukprot:scaffold17122_cov67-Phaeocystis_antarctica.AAC.1